MTAKEKLVVRASRIIEAGQASASTPHGRSRVQEMSLYTLGYAEPGYEGEVVVLGNFNSITRWSDSIRRSEVLDETPSRVAQDLEKLGVGLEWADEWTVCGTCGKLVRTSGNCWSWKRSYWEHDGEEECHECVKADPQEYLQALEGNEEAAATIDLDLAEHGYVLVQDGYENGFHHGQDADAHLIAEALREQGASRFIFRLEETSQFYFTFSVYVHRDELATLDLEEFKSARTDGPSVSDGLRRALADAAQKMDELLGGIKVAKCDVGTGTATVRVVTPQEFIDGKALD